jgi:multisubunit Na+/H+ antiporter MnhE subunit
LRRAWIFALGLLIGGGFYLLLIDTLLLPEVYLLIGVAIACAMAFALSREQGFAEARIRPWWLLNGWRVLLKIFLDIVLLCWEAVAQLLAPRQARGNFRAVRFQATEETPQDAGRRALTEWLGSVAPNTIVVGVDAKRKLLLVHQLHRQGEPDQVDPLGLG